MFLFLSPSVAFNSLVCFSNKQTKKQTRILLAVLEFGYEYVFPSSVDLYRMEVVFFLHVYMYIHVHVCECACSMFARSMGMWACSSGSQKLISCFSQFLFTLFAKAGSLHELGAH